MSVKEKLIYYNTPRTDAEEKIEQLRARHNLKMQRIVKELEKLNREKPVFNDYFMLSKQMSYIKVKTKNGFLAELE